ncbi:hypothetical protein DL95DRAFT_397449, partial [Leptodontidium sp. 2 PMI_412]
AKTDEIIRDIETSFPNSSTRTAPRNSVRVIWVSSSAADSAPHPAIDFTNMDYHREEGIWSKYLPSKAGNVLHSAEFARRTADEGIISLVGNFVTNLQQNMPKMQLAMFKLITHHPKKGPYTELFAGLSLTITEHNDGGWARKDLVDPELGRKYWERSEEQVKAHW